MPTGTSFRPLSHFAPISSYPLRIIRLYLWVCTSLSGEIDLIKRERRYKGTKMALARDPLVIIDAGIGLPAERIKKKMLPSYDSRSSRLPCCLRIRIRSGLCRWGPCPGESRDFAPFDSPAENPINLWTACGDYPSTPIPVPTANPIFLGQNQIHRLQNLRMGL